MEHGSHGPEKGPELRLTEEQQRELAKTFLGLAAGVRRMAVKELGLPLLDRPLTQADIDRVADQLEHFVFETGCEDAGISEYNKHEVLGA